VHLPDITLVLVAGDIIAPTEAALRDVLGKFSFPEVLAFASKPIEGARTILTNIRSSDDAGRFHHTGVLPHLKTSHALFMEWDGYPTSPEMWNDQWREYDYIGAVWPWFDENTVGNCGFCLRSRRLMTALAEMPYIEPVDIMTGRHYRAALESEFMIFAPETVANKFSREYWPPTGATFGFHGVWNFPRHMDDAQIKERLALLEPAQWRAQGISTLAHHALWAGRRDLFRWVSGEKARRA
jgi:hypothetical protein